MGVTRYISKHLGSKNTAPAIGNSCKAMEAKMFSLISQGIHVITDLFIVIYLRFENFQMSEKDKFLFISLPREVAGVILTEKARRASKSLYDDLFAYSFLFVNRQIQVLIFITDFSSTHLRGSLLPEEAFWIVCFSNKTPR